MMSPLIPRREVEHLEATHGGGACQRPGLRRGQVIAAGGLLDVLLQERRLAEEDVGTRGEARDLGDVRRREECVHHVGDLLAGRRHEQLLAQRRKGPAAARDHLDRGVGGRSGAHGILQHVEPPARTEAGGRERVGAHVQVRALGHGIRHRHDAVIERHGLDREDRVGEHDAGERPGRTEQLALEPALRREAPVGRLALADVGHLDREGVFLGQVPGVAGELALDAVGEACGSVEP